MTSGTLWLDLSTASPAAASTVRTAAEPRRIAVVDAPLGGSPEEARDGRLLCFAGGRNEDIERARRVLEAIAAEIVAVGRHGSSYLTKLLANALWFGQAVATAEALAVADGAGLDVTRIQGAEQLRSLQDAAAELDVTAEVLDAVADVYADALRLRRAARSAPRGATRRSRLRRGESSTRRWRMKAIVVRDRDAGTAGMRLEERPDPEAALAGLESANYGDVVVEVRASSLTGNELEWASTWVDRQGRDRTQTIPGHELAGVVTSLSYGTTGLSVGQRVYGLTDWTRDGTLAEYVMVEARNLAPLPADVEFTDAAGVAMTGLTAWQGLFDHGRLRAGQSVLVHGAAGAVGSMAAQLARQAGAYVIGSGRAAHRQTALDFGAHEFVDPETDALEEIGGVDLVLDVFGGDIGARSAALVRPGGTLVSVTGPPEVRPADGLAIDFVVVSVPAQLSEIARRLREGRLRTNIGTIATLDDAVAAFNPTERVAGKTVIRVGPSAA